MARGLAGSPSSTSTGERNASWCGQRLPLFGPSCHGKQASANARGSRRHHGARVALDDGEPVLAVDAPKSLDDKKRRRWRKYRRASADPESLNEDDLLDPHETTHHDFVSVH